MLMKFPIAPNQYQIIGDKHVTDQITSMNNENPYDENTPTESNPDRKSLIDREQLERLYDGDVPESVVPTDPDEIPEGGTVLQSGEPVEGDDSLIDDSSDGKTDE